MKKSGIWINIGLVIVSVIVTSVVIELLLRYEHSIYKKELMLKYGHREDCLCSDRKLVYRGIPNKCENNSHGYRDFEYSYTKAPGTYRMIVIGDSIALGQGVNLEDTFSKVLEKKLNTSVQAKKFEVILLAQSGYSTSQELWVLKKEAFLYHPDAILWSYCLNDPADPVFHNADGEQGRYFYNSDSYLFDYVRKKIFLFIESRKSKECQDDLFDSFLHCAYWDQVKRNIKEIGRIAHQKGVPAFFLIHPTFFEGKSFAEYPLCDLHKKLFILASSSGLIPIDLLDCYMQYDPKQIKYFNPSQNDPWHLNAQGNLAVANYLYEFLQNYWCGNGKVLILNSKSSHPAVK